jgi:hypothetical protein
VLVSLKFVRRVETPVNKHCSYNNKTKESRYCQKKGNEEGYHQPPSALMAYVTSLVCAEQFNRIKACAPPS